MKAARLAHPLAAVALLAGCATATHADLGPLENYYHDTAGSRGAHRDYVRNTLRLALKGDPIALNVIFNDPADFGTGGNEGYSELPGLLLRALGDVRYAEFVASQPARAQSAALRLFPDQIPNFAHAYPRTAALYRKPPPPGPPISL